MERSLAPRTEFCREVAVEPWPRGGITVEVEADPAERRALARRFDLLELRQLRGHGRLERPAAEEICLDGWLEAELSQACVISLEPVPAAIREPVRRRYRRDVAAAEPPAADDELEPLIGGRIDVGETFAEALGLALDPYPHAEGAAARLAAELGPDVSFSPAPSDDDGPPGAVGQSLAR